VGLERAVRAIHLQPTDSIPSEEWVDHPRFIQQVTGLDAFEQPLESSLELVRRLDIDWVTDLPRTAMKFERGQTEQRAADGSRYTEWGFTGSVWEDESLFHDPDEVLAYRPLEDAAGPQRVRVVSRAYREGRIQGPREVRRVVGDATLVSGLYYTTLFQYGIMAFGWENFLTAAASEPETFRLILDQFAQLSVENVTEWVRDDCPVFFTHDDLAISSGLVFPVEWYRREILPRYERIFEPAHAAGKKIIFVSDGNYMPLMDDLAALGVHGFMIDPSNDLAWVLERFGRDHVVIGNIDTSILTFSAPTQVEAEVRRCAELGRGYPGYFFRAAGDLPHNVPLENMHAYFEAKRRWGAR